MAEIAVPADLLAAAERAAQRLGSTAERKTLKALRDTVKRVAKIDGLGYASCRACHGLALETEGLDDCYRCLECGAPVEVN